MKGILNSANIEQFYPSIGLNLLKECISWARDYVQISKEEEQIIMHCRKSLLWVLRCRASVCVSRTLLFIESSFLKGASRGNSRINPFMPGGL